jgi:hypothetical protein
LRCIRVLRELSSNETPHSQSCRIGASTRASAFLRDQGAERVWSGGRVVRRERADRAAPRALWVALGMQALFSLLALPLADLVERQSVEKTVLVPDPDPTGGEPPLDGPPDRGASAPAVRVAAALVVVRIVDSLKQRPLHSSRVAPVSSTRELGIQSWRSAARLHPAQLGRPMVSGAWPPCGRLGSPLPRRSRVLEVAPP